MLIQLKVYWKEIPHTQSSIKFGTSPGFPSCGCRDSCMPVFLITTTDSWRWFLSYGWFSISKQFKWSPAPSNVAILYVPYIWLPSPDIDVFASDDSTWLLEHSKGSRWKKGINNKYQKISRGNLSVTKN